MHRDAFSGPATGARRAGRRLVALTAAVLPLAACSTDKILEVTDIDVARPGAIADSTALPALLAGAIGDFGSAFNGGGDFNQVTLSGTLSDEMINTETFPTRIEVDQRRQRYDNNGSLRDAFYAIQQARASADRASDGYGKFKPNDVGHAEALNISALAYIILAENYCGAVPVSRESSPGVFEFGAALTTDQLLNVAVRKADSAFALATAAGTSGTAANKTTQERLARVIKARALVNLGKQAEASAAIGGEAGVPSTYQYIYKHSETSGRQNNGTWSTTISVARFGAADKKGTNGLPFRSEGDNAGTVKDPRVSNIRRSGTGLGFDGATPQWMPQKYAVRDAASVLADGVEARLIEAEAKLRAGDYTSALTILNGLRSNAALLSLRGYAANSLPALLPAVGQAAQEDQLFKERAYWLYLTSHRVGDLRRLIRQYGRGTETVFPTGNYHKPGTFGTDVNTPIPQAEDNNPNFQRSACVTSKA